MTNSGDRPWGEHQLTDRGLAVLILFGSVLSTIHSLWMVAAMLPATVANMTPLRSSPWTWWISGACCLAVAAYNWSTFEDHVFFGGYQLVAVGIALTRADFRESIKLQLRWLTGTLFGVAVGWKLLSSSYVDGSLFRTVLLFDERFDPITLLLGPVSAEALASDRELIDAVGRGEIAEVQQLESAAALSFLSPLLSVWTIVIEIAIAVAFLAPDRWRAARLRHPALLVFCVTTYAVAPVLGFAVMLSAVGLSLSPGRITQTLYLLVPMLALTRGVQILL